MFKFTLQNVCSCLIIHLTKMLISPSIVVAVGWSNPIVLTALTIIEVSLFIADLLRIFAQ